MKSNENLYSNLHNANMELWLRTCQLLQDERSKWMQLGGQALGHNIDEMHAEMQQICDSMNNQVAMTGMPNNVAWRVLQTRMNELQSSIELLVKNQTAFFTGYQHALAEWQRESTKAMSAAGEKSATAMPVNAVFKDFLKNMGALGNTDESGKTK